MSRQVVDSLKRLRNWVFAAPSRVTKIATGEGIAGTSAAPTQSSNNDTSIGSRLDHGETYEKGGKRYKQYANQDSHRVWAQADLEIGAIPDKEAVEKLFDDMQSGLERP
ncbi:hypothetical protein PAAG_00198 [Paracoccidioides lutzii Pb01]|uniref:Uncharacterized protein n=1 Tax=Paracoccidioides lutzii (strain ATCC MYA-826 / Pb01) TaxID=502779 RepID=C1GNV3_PARBA|nr:hypothetical protein PAAG_00198 [Paracoccidioides lutzii Pb01]EEH35875.2 hypothetical protein PAAG_00198 [Paracoccidioides lutzii Pb01]